jgi:hypothetical protein
MTLLEIANRSLHGKQIVLYTLRIDPERTNVLNQLIIDVVKCRIDDPCGIRGRPKKIQTDLFSAAHGCMKENRLDTTHACRTNGLATGGASLTHDGVLKQTPSTIELMTAR